MQQGQRWHSPTLQLWLAMPVMPSSTPLRRRAANRGVWGGMQISARLAAGPNETNMNP